MRSQGIGADLWDVVVVGAGPAGSAAATLLSRAGLRVLLLDRAARDLPAKVCGEYASPGCLPILRRLGALVALRAVGRPLVGMVIHTAAGRTRRATYATAGPEHSHGLSVARAHLDRTLLDLARTSGAAFESAFQVSDVLWDGLSIEVRGRLHGCEAMRRARLVIGADGRHSVVARRLGSVQPHRWLDKMAFVVYLERARRDAEFGEVFLGRDRYAILNPIADDLTNLGVVVNRRDLPRGADPRRALWAMARSLPGLGARLCDARVAAPGRCLGPLAFRATRLAGARAVLVGDAAGFLDPFTGEGIYAALRSAELAAGRILSGWTVDGPGPEVLASYARDWTQEFGPKWRFATHLQRAIRRPALAEWVVAALGSRPRLASRLLAAAGDTIPPRDLSLWRLCAPEAFGMRSRRG